jgi:CheY-like chemotaxis protein
MDRPDHILIVDDDAEIRSLLTRYLEKNGQRATAVATAAPCGRRWTAAASTWWCWT